MTNEPHAYFVVKGYTPRLIKKFWCLPCKTAGKKHRVIYVRGAKTNSSSEWGPKIPTTMRRCTSCGATDGPWIKIKDIR